MGALRVEVEPGEVGFDAERLARIDRHFVRYVDDGRLPGWLLLLSRHGKIVHLSTYGQRDLEASLPVELDTKFRIYSMTKPITSVAAMMLYEEGAFELKDQVKWYLPSFGRTRVYRGGPSYRPETEPVVEPMRIWHLLTHTAGLTYGFQYAHPVDAIYRAAGFEWGTPEGVDLAGCCELWAGLPLLFQPGSEWSYSVATDVLGRIIEVLSGQPLDRFLEERILEPLGMTDTAFRAGDDGKDRLAALYNLDPSTRKAVRNVAGDALNPPACLSGGAGLISTAADYHRFTQLLRRGGELDGTRLLGTRTLRYMTRNHLPGGADLEAFGRSLFAETTFDGVGFGLGFAVVGDPVANRVVSSPGEFNWGGAASTFFWVDPSEDITGLFLTQLLPSTALPLRSQLRQLVYQALVD
jgi:CubicO group peptidase (beta-lactamase class C family)